MRTLPRSIPRVVAFAVVCAMGLLAPTQAQADTTTVLRDRILRALRGSTSTSPSVAVRAAGLRGIDYKGWETRRPASTLKLYTGLVGLLELGPDTKLRTYVRGTGILDVNGVLSGDLELVGGGDPLFSTTGLRGFAATLVERGVKRVRGRLYGNDLRYDRLRNAPGWRSSYIPDQTGPLSALAVAGNRWRTDDTYIRNPVIGNVGLFRKYLKEAGITVDGGNYVGAARGTVTLAASRPSRTIAELVRYIEKWSYNFGAELLLKEIGYTTGSGTTAAGINVVKKWAAGWDTTTGTMADGSGLSLYDKLRPWDVVAWLHRAERTPVFQLFKSSLPMGCEYESTLRKRFCGTAGAGRVYAKTGNLAGTITLAGYTTTASGRAVRFSFALPSCESRDTCRKAIDRAVLAIVNFGG